jgi:hypothetical protein
MVINVVVVFVTPPAVAEAVIVAVPAVTPDTLVVRPVVGLTVATPSTLELHVTVAEMALPFWSFGLAVSVICDPAPTVLLPEIVTDVSTGVGAVVATVICTVCVTVVVPAVAEAVIVVVPAATADTSPVPASTLATPGADDVHVTLAAIALPFWSFGAAVSCVVLPTMSEVVGAPMVTDVRTGVGGAVTVINVLFETTTLPALAVAVIVVLPTVSARTSPLPLTEATAGAEDAHVTVAVKAFPFWSFGAALS